MEEAEVYGNGLERGRAMNLYVDNRLNRNTITKPLHKSKNHNHNFTIGKEIELGSIHDHTLAETQIIQIQRLMAFVAGDNSIRIQWSVEPQFHTKLSHIKNFVVEMLQREANKIAKNEWKIIDHVQPHVRALTLRKLSVKANNEYAFIK